MNGHRREFKKKILVKRGKTRDSNIWYKIRFIRGLNTEGFEGRTYDGLCWGSPSYEIWISTGLTPEQRMHTFFHELGHAIEFEHRLKIRHKHIDVLGKALGYIIRKNRWLAGA